MNDAEKQQLAHTLASRLIGLDLGTCAEVSAQLLLGIVEQARGKEVAFRLAEQIRKALEIS